MRRCQLKENTISSIENTEHSLKVIDADKSPDILPTTSIECPRCKNNNAFWWMLQTRSADEAYYTILPMHKMQSYMEKLFLTTL